MWDFINLSNLRFYIFFWRSFILYFLSIFFLQFPYYIIVLFLLDSIPFVIGMMIYELQITEIFIKKCHSYLGMNNSKAPKGVELSLQSCVPKET